MSEQITIKKQEATVITVNIVQSGANIDVAAFAIVFAARAEDGVADVINLTLALDPTQVTVTGDDNSLVTVSLSSTDTDLASGHYTFELRLTDLNLDEDVVACGTITILDSITA